ncbi:MAG TPA: ATP-binding protein [Pyrinomonadaceae bacterium]|nr:ATP-binding protein [Pyrinomonadaceae bacterium]
MKLIEQLEIENFSGPKVVAFFTALTVLVTGVVVLIWEKVFMLPFYAWVAASFPGDEARLYYIEQRIEHFVISTAVDVLIVTLLLRVVSRQQHRLAASEKRFRALFEHASDGIGVVNASDHHLVEVNNKFCEILGCQPKGLIGKDIHTLVRADGAEPDPLAGLLADASPDEEVELQLQTPDGQTVSAAVTSNHVRADGERLVLLMVHDLSERKRLEAEREEMQRQLFQSSKLASIGELSAGVAHEINNPVNGIINFAQLLKDDAVAQTEDQRRMVDGIIDEGERIARIVRNLLTFARQDPHQLTRVHISDSVKASMSLFAHQLRKDGIEVEIDLEDGLPPVMADGSRLRQVVVNMISNAHHALRAKAAGRKVFRITARLVARGGDERVRVEFYDNGVGIRREDLDKVFDPFFTTRRATGGTGLGLSLSFGIVREFGGTITVESVEGSHTRFTVELPAAGSREVRHEQAKSVGGGR